jgi:hypothetical protein
MRCWATVDIGCEVEVSLGLLVDVSRSSQKKGGDGRDQDQLDQ